MQMHLVGPLEFPRLPKLLRFNVAKRVSDGFVLNGYEQSGYFQTFLKNGQFGKLRLGKC